MYLVLVFQRRAAWRKKILPYRDQERTAAMKIAPERADAVEVAPINGAKYLACPMHKCSN